MVARRGFGRLLVWVVAPMLGAGCGVPGARRAAERPVSGSLPALTRDVIDDARRFLQPSNDLRVAALEEELRRRDLPYTVQAFPGPGADRDPRPRGRNLVVSFGSGAPEVIVGGHLDAIRLPDGSLGHGMVDNAAGVVVLLEVARALRTAPLHRRVRVVFFDMEELGLVGSAAFVRSIDPDQVAAMINVDIVAYGDTMLFGPGDVSPDNRPAHVVQRVCARHAMPCIGTPRMPPSDDRSFQRAGIPAVSLAMLPADEAHRLWILLNGDRDAGLPEGFAPEIMRTIHTERDTIDKLEPAALTRAYRIVTDVVRALDAAPRQPSPAGGDRQIVR